MNKNVEICRGGGAENFPPLREALGSLKNFCKGWRKVMGYHHPCPIPKILFYSLSNARDRFAEEGDDLQYKTGFSFLLTECHTLSFRGFPLSFHKVK